jgi:hypothetical protein
LLSKGIGQPVGTFLSPATILPRVSGSVKTVVPHNAVNDYLTTLLGPSLDTIQSQANAHDVAARSELAEDVLNQPFINTILSDQDTYTLLQSQAMTGLVGSEQVGGTQTGDTVTYVVPQSSVTIGTDTSTVSVPASNGASGFIAQVPNSGIRLLPDGEVSVDIPQSSIPAYAPQPTTTTITTGTLGDVYAATGPLLADALRTGSARQGPTSPPTVPGLRLFQALAHHRNLASGAGGRFLYMFRLAVERHLFTLSAGQQAEVNDGFNQFTATVNRLNQAGTFQPAVPPAPQTLTKGPLGGTHQVSVGALRRLANVASPLSGLQLPGVGNFPGRIDAGYVFTRNGDYGLVLTARGPLLSAPAGVSSADLVSGDVQIAVSNASTLAALNGTSIVEGLTVGDVLSGSLGASSNANGVHTTSAAVGYGTGLDFGTGVAYTQVIPLGNVFALIPQAPRR